MKKLWLHLCFLVVAMSPLCRGQSESVTDADQSDKYTFKESSNNTNTPPSLPENDINGTLPVSSTSNKNHTSENVTDVPDTNVTVQEDSTSTEDFMKGGHTTASTLTTLPTDSITTATTNNTPVTTAAASGSRGGYVILILIILVIIVLCIILYFLRRVSRTYSFDLQRPSPANHRNEPMGTFEPVYLDDLERPAKDHVTTNDDLPPPPVANGTSLESEEKDSDVENATPAPQQQPDANGLETASIGDASPSADNTSDHLGSTVILFDAAEEEPQNENNNNSPSVCSSDPFVEINLEEPAWSDQLLSSTEAPSSVLPFSPFSIPPSPFSLFTDDTNVINTAAASVSEDTH